MTATPKVEIYIGGAWEEITSLTVHASARITRGKTPGATRAESDRLVCVLMDDDGSLAEGNPLSSRYPDAGRGCLIRLSGTISAVDYQRFYGTIDTMRVTYPAPGRSRIAITAVGSLGQVGQGSDPLLSPIHRTMIGTAPGDFAPTYYWPGEDPAGSLSMASAISGVGPMLVSGPPTFAGDSTLPGSDPLVSYAVGQGATATIPATGLGDGVAVAWWMMIPAEPSASVTLARMTTSGTLPTWSVTLNPGAPSVLHIIGRDATGTTVVDQSVTMNGTVEPLATEDTFYGRWLSYTLQLTQVGLDLAMAFTVRSIEAPLSADTSVTSQFASLSDAVLNQTVGVLRLIRQPGLIAMSAGHWAVYEEAGFVSGSGDYYNAQAMLGWAGEEAHDRFARLCTEQGISYVVYGDTSPPMGMQRQVSLGANLQDCNDVDRGLMHDGGADGAVVFVCLDYLTNQAAAYDLPDGLIGINLTVIWDNQLTANDVTSSRPDGSSARVVDAAHIARVGKRWTLSPSANVETDEQVGDDAGWAVWVGTAPGPRYDSIGLLGHASAASALGATLAGLAIGNRITAQDAVLPDQHPPGGIDQLIVGVTESLDSVEWHIGLHTVPYSPYVVGILAETSGDTDPYLGWLSADSCALNAGVSSSATSWAVNSTPLWSTAADDFPCEVTVGGEPVTVTTVTGGSNPQTWTVTRSATLAKAHDAGDDIELVHPIVLTIV